MHGRDTAVTGDIVILAASEVCLSKKNCPALDGMESKRGLERLIVASADVAVVRDGDST